MGATSIGIKLADSKFYPILEEGQPTSKILELTTVRDNQTSVQINLFRTANDTVENSEYVGTLIIEDIAERASGEPTIELTLTVDESNELSAEAIDRDSGSRQVLRVSLETLDDQGSYSLPDFDLTPVSDSISLGADPEHVNLMEGTIPGNAPEGLYEMNEEEKKNGVFMPAWLCVLILVIGVAALALALLVSARVLLRDKSADQMATVPPVVEVPVVPVEAEPTVAPVAVKEDSPPPAAVIETVVVEETPVVPTKPEPVPAKDVRYKIKWGDTLWDISESYYKTPWRYTDLAKFNKIRNPNLIIAGTYLTIPAN